MYFRAIRLGNEARGRRENERGKARKGHPRGCCQTRDPRSDVIFGNGGGRRGGEGARRRKLGVGEKRDAAMRVGLRQRPFVREWVWICVSYNAVVETVPGSRGPAENSEERKCRGRSKGGGRDICTERGVKILNGRKYA